MDDAPVTTAPAAPQGDPLAAERIPSARYCEVCAELEAGLLARGGDPCSELCPQKRFGG